MKKYLLISLLLISSTVFGQIPEDAIRYSWLPHSGTARYMAIGGVMGSLGGDLSAAYVNPAGLGFYHTGEFAISPGFQKNRNKSTFRDGASTQYNKNVFNLGTIGLVNGFKNRELRNTSYAIALTQTANFKNVIKYSALNNHSSFSEQFAEEFSRSGQSIDDILNTGSALPYTAAPALYTYLIDTVWDGTKYVVRGAPETILDAGQALRQEVTKTTSGGIYELAFSVAGDFNQKWFGGITAGVPIVSYKGNSVLTETDTSANTSNLFKRAVFTDELKTSGIGLNLKLGLIYRPKEYIRLGLAIHSPSVIYQTDQRTTNLFNEREGLDSVRIESASSDIFTTDSRSKTTYLQQTPWKAIISASYVFREVADVRRQKGFISADIEYVNHRSSRFKIDEESEATFQQETYYEQLNESLKEQYKGTFNFRVGGELKFNVIMARLGFAYYSNPYKEDKVKANKMLLSGGLGYRHKGIFLDLTYVHQVSKDVHFPYRLADRENTFAKLNQKQGGITATLGFKF